MKVLLINSVCGIRSTGRICTDIARDLEAQSHEVKIAYGRMEQVPEWAKRYAVRIGADKDLKLHALRTRLLDEHGFGSRAATERFLKWADSYNPDMLWLHNIHGYYINVELLFHWIKTRPDMQVKWTLHDCWAFTGHCGYFDYARCDRWRTGCGECPQRAKYPTSLLLDASKNNYKRKRAAFTGVTQMSLITPSKWLADLTRDSFLSEYPVEVHHNKIDLQIFKSSPGDFRKRYGLENKKIVLGVASPWSARKGLDDFCKLSRCVSSGTKIVLVGLSKKQIKELPDSILGIERTDNAQELAEIYTAADIFFNPTYEDNYPTVNLEAQACGTKVVTYDTGGAPETLYREDAVVIKQGDWQRVVQMLSDEDVEP